MFGFQGLQGAEQAIVIRIRNQRRIKHVILVTVLFDLGPQGTDALAGVHVGIVCRVQENRRCAKGPPAGSWRWAIAVWYCTTCRLSLIHI